MPEENLQGIMEAVLFAAGDPVTTGQLMRILELEEDAVEAVAADLAETLQARGSGLTLRQVAGGYQMVTRPEYFFAVKKLTQVVDRKLSAPTMETLSIIAFKQPITKQEIEQIRGVRIERALAKLIELEFVCEKGRKSVLGRPILYGTTDTFLRCFGLNSLADLPKLPTAEEAAIGMDEEQMRLLQESMKENEEQETEEEEGAN